MRDFSFYKKYKKTVQDRTKQGLDNFRNYKKLRIAGTALFTLIAVPVVAQAASGSILSNGFADDFSLQTDTLSDFDQPIDASDEPSASFSNSTLDDGNTNTNISVETSNNSKKVSESANNKDVNLSVNGQQVPVPANGTVHKTMSGNGGHSVVDVQVHNGSTSYSSSSSSTVVIEQYSHSSGDQTNQQGSNSRHPIRR